MEYFAKAIGSDVLYRVEEVSLKYSSADIRELEPRTASTRLKKVQLPKLVRLEGAAEHLRKEFPNLMMKWTLYELGNLITRRTSSECCQGLNQMLPANGACRDENCNSTTFLLVLGPCV